MIGAFTPSMLLSTVVGRVDTSGSTTGAAVKKLFPGANAGSSAGGTYSTDAPLNMTRPPEPGFLDNLKHGDPKAIAMVAIPAVVIALIALKKRKKR